MRRVLIIVILVVCAITGLIWATPAPSNKPNNNPLSEFIVKNEFSDTILYVINKHIDLKEQTITLPANAILKFDKGLISNGTLIGDSTRIVPNNTPLFDNVIIKGSWKIVEIKTDFFQTVDEHTAANLTALSSEKQYNIIEINHDFTVPVKPWSSYFTIKSNTDVVLNADIYTSPTTNQGGYCLNVSGERVRIQGNNHYLFGSLANPQQKECYQWLHGLNITDKSSHVEIENLNSWYFCGDGFYNSGSNITFNNVNAKFNGRQGLSITNGSNIRVLNSSFTYTGFYRICTCNGPGAGIDIEPNDGDQVHDVLINNCIIAHNFRYMEGYLNDLEIYSCHVGNIKVINCNIGGLYLGTCSGILIEECESIQSIYGINTDISDIRINNNCNPLFSNRAKSL